MASRTAYGFATMEMPQSDGTVAEGNFGRMGRDQQQRYSRANARIQLDPSVGQPGAMPEIAPSPEFGPSIDRLFTERSLVPRAWGTYGTLWPVIARQLGVTPDLGRGRLDVVPQVPVGRRSVAGSSIRLGAGSVDVQATSGESRYTATVAGRLDGGYASVWSCPSVPESPQSG